MERLTEALQEMDTDDDLKDFLVRLSLAQRNESSQVDEKITKGFVQLINNAGMI